MKTLLFLIVLCPVFGWSEGPEFKHKDPTILQEFENVYVDLRDAKSSSRAVSKTLANIILFTPGAAGTMVYCSDCVTDAICVSTGAVVNSFVRVSARTTKCQ